ncbi:Uncharacterized protein Adt_10352 [Abeliophyllum distichum]|uniref:Uncharacterized protein n=1 Tax=Abeliophyllum distichum TaxID=126358 RepID=A0ABD1UJS7_9LAMI
MQSIVPHVTLVRNDTIHSIDFAVEEGRCPIPSLRPGRRRLVNLSKILKICRRLGSASWLIKVLIDQKLKGVTLEAGDFLYCVQISFKIVVSEIGRFTFIAEGVKERKIDTILRLSRNIGFILGRDIFWNRREHAVIACALLDYPTNMQQMRQEDSKRVKAPKSQQREGHDSLMRRVRNLCSKVDVSPETMVNSKKLKSPLRMEGNRQGAIKSEDSMNPKTSIPSKREGKKSHLGSDKDVLVWSKKVMSPERKPTVGDIALDASKHVTFETRIPNSVNVELHFREGTDSDFHHRPHQLTEQVEFDPQSHSSDAVNMDRCIHIFLLMFSLLLVGFIRVLLLGFQSTP